VLDQRFDSVTGRASPEDPTTCAVVLPHEGNFLVFDGELGHGVLESAETSVRMTLLVNWWSKQPIVRFLFIVLGLVRRSPRAAHFQGR
jgi:hypothetical protein